MKECFFFIDYTMKYAMKGEQTCNWEAIQKSGTSASNDVSLDFSNRDGGDDDVAFRCFKLGIN